MSTEATTAPPTLTVMAPARRRRQQAIEWLIRMALLLCALVSVAVTFGIILVLFGESLGFFADVSVAEFITGTRWAPLFTPPAYGILPLVWGTLMIAVGAAIVSIPLGVGSALYLSEYASHRIRTVLKPALEVLAGIPTVVYGYFALTFITPAIRLVLPQAGVFNAASAAIAVGIMILPMVASLCDDAFRAVPRSLRYAGYAMGATPLEVSTRIVVPGALSGVIASFILAISRAIGETMIVTIAAGMNPQLTLNPLEPVQTMTSFIVQVSKGDAPVGSIGYRSIFAVGMLLFVMTLGMNVAAHRILSRYREAYE